MYPALGRSSVAIGLSLLLSCASHPARVAPPQSGADPFVGTWELDASSLRYEAGRPGRRATYVIEAIPAGLLFRIEAEDADGRPLRFQYGGPLDGTRQPLPGAGEAMLILKREGERLIESIVMRGEKVLDRWVRELAADGQSIKMTQFVKEAGGRDALNTSVYRRVKLRADR